MCVYSYYRDACSNSAAVVVVVTGAVVALLMLFPHKLTPLPATDHVGKSTTAQSPGVTIDGTPPDVTGASIDVGGAYTTERNEISASWKGVFVDAESGEDCNLWYNHMGHRICVAPWCNTG